MRGGLYTSAPRAIASTGNGIQGPRGAWISGGRRQKTCPKLQCDIGRQLSLGQPGLVPPGEPYMQQLWVDFGGHARHSGPLPSGRLDQPSPIQ
jgi:hypothetical protein